MKTTIRNLTRGGMAALVLLAALALPAPMLAQHPNVARGFTPSGLFEVGGITTLLEYQGTRVIKRSRRVWDGTKEVLGTTREEYDSLGRLHRIREPNGTWTRYDYDAGGRLAAVTSNAGASATQTRSFRYDGRGFLMRDVQPESGALSYQYDARGNLTTKITPTGTVLYQYDAANRLTQVSSPQTPLRILSYFPSGAAKGRLQSARAFNDRQVGASCLRYEVRQDYAYNPSHGRLETELTSLFQGGTSLEKWTQGYTYDGDGQVTQLTYPSCLAGCAATARSQTITYEMGHPTALLGVAGSITYNDNGLVKTIAHLNGVTFSQSPDPSGMARTGSLGTNRDWQAESYTYDGSGNIKTIGAKSFAYDLSSRLTSATIPSIATPYRGYAYDVFGNLIQVAQGASANNVASYVNYTADTATNRLRSAAYDTSGNLLSYQGSSYTWDVLGNLTTSNTGTEQWIHTYDVAGERVWSWQVSPTPRVDRYTLRGLDNKVLSTFTKTASAYTWEDYVYRGGQLLAARYSDGRVTHFDVDHLGSVRQETDANGAIIKYREFWPYGEEATAPSGTERMKFTGHERDLGDPNSTADDTDYMHARYYKPLLGRFLSVDPIEGDPYTPQSWNRYSYVKNNPILFTDPTGKFSIRDWWNRVVDSVAAYTGVTLTRDAVVRKQYTRTVSKLDPKDSAGRTAAKAAARERTSPAGRAMAEKMRPMSKESTRLGGTASKTNSVVNESMEAAGKLGKGLVVVGVAVSVTNIATAPEGQKLEATSQEAGSWVGALSGGEAGAEGGAGVGVLIGGPPGAAVGAVIGGVSGAIVGGIAGEEAGDNLYHLFTDHDN